MLNVILLHGPTSCLVAGSPPARSSRFGQSATNFFCFSSENPRLNLSVGLNMFLRVCELWPYIGHVPCSRSSTKCLKSSACFFLWRFNPVPGHDLIMEASPSHSDTPHSVAPLWTSDQPFAETSTWQHTTLTRDKHECRPVEFEPVIAGSDRSRSHWGRLINCYGA